MLDIFHKMWYTYNIRKAVIIMKFYQILPRGYSQGDRTDLPTPIYESEKTARKVAKQSGIRDGELIITDTETDYDGFLIMAESPGSGDWMPHTFHRDYADALKKRKRLKGQCSIIPLINNSEVLLDDPMNEIVVDS